MKKQLPAWVVLGLVAVVSAICLAGVYGFTKDSIAQQAEIIAEENRRSLMPDTDFMTLELPEGSAAKHLYARTRGGETVGYIVVLDVPGFAGPVEITVGTDLTGEIVGVMVGGDGFNETPGLGAKARDAAFTDQFTGLAAPIVLGEHVDAITAATITSASVVRGVNTGIGAIADFAGFTIAANKPETAEPDGLDPFTAVASEHGFKGPVAARITVNGAGQIAELIFGDDEFVETKGYGTMILEAGFSEQFLGKTLPIEPQDIDMISGATITSEAAVRAVNAAYYKLQIGDGDEGGVQDTDEPDTLVQRTANASEHGFKGPVAAYITVNSDGQIVNLTFGDDDFAETRGYGTMILEPDFAEQFIGKIPPIELRDIDMISGATITSEAAVHAVNAAYAKLP